MATPVPAVSPAQAAALLAQYAALLRQWNPRINLVAPATLNTLESRHWEDCAQLIQYLPEAPTHILDVGSGAGLPGLVVAALTPQHAVALCESDQRKAAFLHTAVQTLALKNVAVYACRVEQLTSQPGFVAPALITARAFAPADKILKLTAPLLAPGGQWLLLKGQAVDVELRTCETLFPMTITRHPSTVPDKDGRVGWVVRITPTLT
jgi:16S rRNA (guanine527-N7)-methyltransferase